MGTSLLIVSAFLHALWNALLKKIPDKTAGVFAIMLFASITSILISPISGGFQPGTTLALQLAFVAGAFEGGYVTGLAHTLERAPLGLSYAIMRGGAMLIVWCISTLYLHESVTILGILGVLCVFVGLFVVQPRKNEKRLDRLGLLWALFTACCIAGYHIFYGASIGEGSSQVTVFLVSMIVSIPFLGLKNNFYAIKNFKSVVKAQPSLIVFAGVLSATSFIIFLYGLSYTAPGAAITLRNTSVIFAQIFALFLGEKISWHQWLGVLMISGGAVLIT